jgi:hypothetical protein
VRLQSDRYQQMRVELYVPERWTVTRGRKWTHRIDRRFRSSRTKAWMRSPARTQRMISAPPPTHAATSADEVAAYTASINDMQRWYAVSCS